MLHGVTYMALVDSATFDDREVAMVYIAARLGEGKRVEQVLTARTTQTSAGGYCMKRAWSRASLIENIMPNDQLIRRALRAPAEAFCPRPLDPDSRLRHGVPHGQAHLPVPPPTRHHA
jgi:hypothetical protein